MPVYTAATSDPEGRGRLTLNVYEESTSISTNTSRIRVQLTFSDNNASFGGFGTTTWTANVLGNVWTGSLAYDFTGNSGRSYTVLNTNTTPGGAALNYTHNPNGSGSFSVSASTTADSPLGAASVSGTLSSPSNGITDFDFSASAPTSLTATFIAGTGVKLDWPASVSYKTPVTYYLSWRSSSNGGQSYGSWSSEVNTTSLTYTYGSLTPGLTYQFRIRAFNGFDNYSGYRQSNTVFLTSGGKRFDGTDWLLTTTHAKRYNQATSSWVSLTTLKRYDGQTKSWVNLS